MAKKQTIQLFEEKKVRTVWDDEKEKWFFCVVDVVEALTDSKDPKDYIKKMKKRDPELSKGWGQIVTPLSVQTAGGKQKVNCAPREGIFRIIQAIPSPKAEPFKRWMTLRDWHLSRITLPTAAMWLGFCFTKCFPISSILPLRNFGKSYKFS